MFKAFIRIQYRLGRITAEQVRELVTLKRLTQEEADELLGGAEA